MSVTEIHWLLPSLSPLSIHILRNIHSCCDKTESEMAITKITQGNSQTSTRVLNPNTSWFAVSKPPLENICDMMIHKLVIHDEFFGPNYFSWVVQGVIFKRIGMTITWST
jgi:hypothetical protein